MAGNDVKQFGIFVKEGLLDPKHCAAIGDAIWLYLWILNSVTKVEGDTGYVFGGAPINLEKVNEKLGDYSRRSYVRHLNMLKKGGYISTQRTSRGLIITVTKSFKIFSKDAPKTAQQEHDDAPNMPSDAPNMAQRYAKSGATIRQDKDKTIDTTPVPPIPDEEIIFSTLLEAYNATNGTKKLVIGPQNRVNILKWVKLGRSPAEMVEAIRYQPRCSDRFLKELSFEQLFQMSNKTGDADYVEQILKFKKRNERF